MKLWILEPTDAKGSPHRVYDCNTFFIVRAENEVKARILASEQAKDETAECWLSSKWSTCEEYVFPTAEGVSEVVWSEFHPG